MSYPIKYSRTSHVYDITACLNLNEHCSILRLSPFYVLDDGLFVFCSAEYDKYSEDPEFKPATRHSKDIFDEVRIRAFVLELLPSLLIGKNWSECVQN